MVATKTKPRPLHEKFSVDMKRAMRSTLLEREDEIEIFMLALVAKQHAFFLGEPGIAKSMLVEAGMGLIGDLTEDDYFNILFMKSSTREDVFGPLDILALKEGRYRYMPEGFLPCAKFVFGDEFWKANGAIQNALLWATNERKYRNDGHTVTIPLWTMCIASNEMPESDELWAIYDRFLLRRKVMPISEPGNFISMLKLATGDKAIIEPVVTWQEVEQAHIEAEAVVVPNEVLEALAKVKDDLKEENIFPSDRRFRQSISIVQAAAWLDGCAQAEVEHLQVLRHVLWGTENEIAPVQLLMSKISNPIQLEIQEVQEGLGTLGVEVDRIIRDGGDDDMKERAGAEVYEKIEVAKAELINISQRSANSKRSKDKLEQAIDQVTSLTSRLLVQVFKTTPEQIQKGLEKFRAEMAAAGEEDEDGEE